MQTTHVSPDLSRQISRRTISSMPFATNQLRSLVSRNQFCCGGRQVREAAVSRNHRMST
jgi:iron-sulfur cluster repair protein YtfE (RIC family)